MKPLPSIRTRLSLMLLGVGAVWWLAISVALGWVVQHEIDEVLDGALQAAAPALLAAISESVDQPTLRIDLNDSEHLAWQLVDRDARVLRRSVSAPEIAFLPQATPGLSNVGRAWRVFGLIVPNGDGQIFYLAQELAERDDAQFEAIEYTAGTALGVMLCCTLWLRRRLRQELEPLERLSAAVSVFDPLEDPNRLPPADRAELLPLQRAISGLGQKWAQKIRSERAFSAHAAHALRTPLAGMDAQLAVALREATPQGQERLLRVRQAATRLQQVVTALLGLFRSGEEPHCRAVQLSALLAHLPASELVLSLKDDLLLWADPDLLAAALANLLDNAVRHGAHRVQVTAQPQDRGVLIALEDDGPGLPPKRLMMLNQALERQEYDGHTGLGLMLADRVARAHGGRLSLAVGAGGGLEVRLLLPQPAQLTPS